MYGDPEGVWHRYKLTEVTTAVLGRAKGGNEERKTIWTILWYRERGYTCEAVSLTIFNIVVDTVVRAVLLEVYRPQEAHHRFF